MSDTSHVVQVIGGKGRLSREELYPKPTRLNHKGTAKRVAIVIVCLSAICGVYVLLRGHWRSAQGPFVDMQGIMTPSITYPDSEASASKMLDGTGDGGTHGVGVGEETPGRQDDVEGLGDGEGRTEEDLTAAQPTATNEEPGRELDLDSTEHLTQQLIQQQAKILQLLTDKLRKEQQQHQGDQEEQAQNNTTEQHQEQHHLSQHEPTGQSAEHPQNKSKLTEQSKELQPSWQEATNQHHEEHQPSQQESNNQSEEVLQKNPELTHQQHQTESTEALQQHQTESIKALQQPERPVQTKHPEVPPPSPPSSLPKQPVRPKQPEVPPHLPQPHPLPKMLPPVRQHVAKPFNDHMAQPIPSHDEADKTSATHRHPEQHGRPTHETGLVKLPYFHPGIGTAEKAEILKQAMFQRNLMAETRRKAQEWLKQRKAHRTS